MPSPLEILPSPLALAPMAGGVGTVRLAVAATAGGAFGFLPGGYRTPDDLSADIVAFRAASGAAFGVNLFVPPTEPDPDTGVAEYARLLRPEADRLGVSLGQPGRGDDWFPDKIEMLLADPVPLVSFTFGVPDAAALVALGKAGTVRVVTVTSAEEARRVEGLAVDAICVQSAAAGGHRGTHGNYDGSPHGLATLLAEVRRASALPMIAAGGLAGPSEVAAALAAGAAAVQAGTAFLAADESGASESHKDALVEPGARTTLTRAFSGRPARGVVNRFVDKYGSAAPAAYPQVNALTRPLRRAAAAAGDVSAQSLWAGAGHARARRAGAALIARELLSGV